MPLPKKNKKHIPLTYSKTLYPRRQELVDKINDMMGSDLDTKVTIEDELDYLDNIDSDTKKLLH